MKLLVVGSGGREHAVVQSLLRHDPDRLIFVAPGNGGMRDSARCIPIAADDIGGLARFASKEAIDLTFVGPEVPLSLGIVDHFQEMGLTIVGPRARLAQLEASKAFTKRLCREHGIPTARFAECDSLDTALGYIDTAELPIVIKADGLAAGKGVLITNTRDDARAAVRDFMVAGTLGDAGRRVVLEEFLSGREASLMVFADGRSYRPMAVAQDHKRRFDGDTGPNTGGMGAYSTDGLMPSGLLSDALNRIVKPTLDAVRDYSGILYAGLMLTADGPQLIEYNVRFGDPETQVVLPRLETDLAGVFEAIAHGRLDTVKLEWKPGAAVCVVLVAKGYPGKSEPGAAIEGIEEASRLSGVSVYHAGTRFDGSRYVTAGGRVLNVCATGETLAEAVRRAYDAVERIHFEGMDFRRDIGRETHNDNE